MTPERMAELVTRWTRFYTRELPAAIAGRRIEEVAADVDQQIAHERHLGVSDRKICRAIASRTLRGLPADVSWRAQHVAAMPRGARGQTASLRRSVLRVAIGVVTLLAAPLVATVITGSATWSVSDFVLAAVLLAAVGVTLELAVRRAGGRILAAGVAAVGVMAGILGEADDAPGLVLVGILLVGAAGALGVRAAQHGR